MAAASPPALCDSVCNLKRAAMAAFLCSAAAPRLLKSMQLLSPTEMHPDILRTRLCCTQNAASRAQGGTRVLPERLGTFLAQHLEGNNLGQVKRKVCYCVRTCQHGRWQRQHLQRMRAGGSGLLVLKETLRWEEWAEETSDFIPGDYKVYSYSIEVEAQTQEAPHLTDELKTWVQRFQWGHDSEGDRRTRITFCQAFLDPPRRGGTKRPAEGPSTPLSQPTQRHRTAAEHSPSLTGIASANPVPCASLADRLAAAVKHIEQQRSASPAQEAPVSPCGPCAATTLASAGAGLGASAAPEPREEVGPADVSQGYTSGTPDSMEELNLDEDFSDLAVVFAERRQGPLEEVSSTGRYSTGTGLGHTSLGHRGLGHTGGDSCAVSFEPGSVGDLAQQLGLGIEDLGLRMEDYFSALPQVMDSSPGAMRRAQSWITCSGAAPASQLAQDQQRELVDWHTPTRGWSIVSSSSGVTHHSTPHCNQYDTEQCTEYGSAYSGAGPALGSGGALDSSLQEVQEGMSNWNWSEGCMP